MKGYSKRKVTASSTVFFNDGGSGNGFGGSSLISYNQSTRTQLDTAEVAHYDDENIRQFVGIDLSQNRLACRTRWFAVVVGTEAFRSWPNM